jgi:hypothetical protein
MMKRWTDFVAIPHFFGKSKMLENMLEGASELSGYQVG